MKILLIRVTLTSLLIGHTLYLLYRKHGVIKTYMDDLYRGCDILELVGRGKKSAALMTSKGTASIIAEAIDAKIDAMEQPVQSVTTKRGRDKLSQ